MSASKLDHLPLWLRTALAVYPYRRVAPMVAATLRRPLEQSRVALVTTAGLVQRGDRPFDPSVRGGDGSYRVIAGDVDVRTLEEHHRSESFDHAGIEADRNLAFPLDRLREMVSEGVVGEVAPRHLSFMGSVSAVGRLIRRSAPEAAELLVADGVDVALLFPV